MKILLYSEELLSVPDDVVGLDQQFIPLVLSSS